MVSHRRVARIGRQPAAHQPGEDLDLEVQDVHQAAQRVDAATVNTG
jgi:hypothetical protein